jgi:hypothetical protein
MRGTQVQFGDQQGRNKAALLGVLLEADQGD